MVQHDENLPASRDATPSAFESILRQTSAEIERMMREGSPRREILARLASAGEQIAGNESTVSILLLDEEGLLRNGASPKLPADYLSAIDRLKPNAKVGTCAAAAATGQIVVTPDFQADDKWAELRHLPMALGYVGAWSVPIKSPNGTVLGTFGTYFRTRRLPAQQEQWYVQRLAATAARVIANT